MKNSTIEVVTVSGKTLPRNKCRFISNQYYEIGIDCFLMEDGKWHRKNNGKIEFDHETKKYVLLENTSLINGAVGVGSGGQEFELGYFSANPAKNVFVFSSSYGTISCLNEDIPVQCGYKEAMSSGVFYKGMSAAELNKKAINGRYSFNLEYSSAPKLKVFSGSHAEHYSPKNNVNTKFFKELGDTSFGFEFETENGYIPERHLFRNGLIPLRDGSLRHDNIEPYEYTTIPLSGSVGLHTLVDDVELLKKHTTIGHKCSLHLHVGGFTPTKELVIAAHKLMIRTQDEIYSLFPSNYKFTSNNGFKSKDYCAPTKNIKFAKTDTVDDKFMRIFNHYAGTSSTFKGFGRENHPKDRSNTRKWEVNERYFGLNFIPFIWGPTGTFEWRMHLPTQNINKIVNWLFIASGILKFADKYKDSIANDEFNMKPASLEYILRDIYSKELADILVAYMAFRVNLVNMMETKLGDVIGDYELKHDLDEVEQSIL